MFHCLAWKLVLYFCKLAQFGIVLIIWIFDQLIFIFQGDPVKLLIRLSAFEAHNGIAVASTSIGPCIKMFTKHEQVCLAESGTKTPAPYRVSSLKFFSQITYMLWTDIQSDGKFYVIYGPYDTVCNRPLISWWQDIHKIDVTSFHLNWMINSGRLLQAQTIQLLGNHIPLEDLNCQVQDRYQITNS